MWRSRGNGRSGSGCSVRLASPSSGSVAPRTGPRRTMAPVATIATRARTSTAIGVARRRRDRSRTRACFLRRSDGWAPPRREYSRETATLWYPRLEGFHPAYFLCVRARSSVSSVSNRLAGDRPVPDLITEVPGPKARAHVAYDETWTSPSLPRAYPIVHVRGDGLTVEDIDGNLFLDFAAGIAVTSTGHSHPQVVGAIKEQAGDLLHFSASDFYLPIYAQTCERIAGITPIAGGRARTYLGNSGAEVVEAAIKLARHV